MKISETFLKAAEVIDIGHAWGHEACCFALADIAEAERMRSASDNDVSKNTM